MYWFWTWHKIQGIHLESRSEWSLSSQWSLQRTNVSELGPKLSRQADSILHVNLVVMVIGGKGNWERTMDQCCGKRGFCALHKSCFKCTLLNKRQAVYSPAPRHCMASRKSSQITPSLSLALFILLRVLKGYDSWERKVVTRNIYRKRSKILVKWLPQG